MSMLASDPFVAPRPGEEPAHPREVRLHACTVDLLTGTVRRTDGEALLTQRERVLLAYLVARPSRDTARDELLAQVWGYTGHVLSRTVDTTMRRLRDKVERDPSQPEHLLTAFGTGYRFEPLQRACTQPRPLSSQRAWLRFGARQVDPATGLVCGPNGEVLLTSIERAILDALGERMGDLLLTRELVQAVWGRWTGGTRALNTAIYRLRRKLEPNPDQPRYLLTVRRSGFRLLCDQLPSSQAVATLVAVQIHRESDLWEADPEGMGARVAPMRLALEASAVAAGGVPTGDGGLHLFTEPEAARRWALSLHSFLPPLSIALVRGHLIWWTDPTSRRTLCAGPAALRCRELLSQAGPGLIAAEEGPPQEQVPSRPSRGRRTHHGPPPIHEVP